MCLGQGAFSNKNVNQSLVTHLARAVYMRDMAKYAIDDKWNWE